MKFRFIAILGLVVALVSIGCSSSSNEKPQITANANSSINSNSNSTLAVTTGDQVGAPQPADANSTADAPGDPVAPPASSALQSKLETLRKSGKGSGDFGDVEAMALKSGRMAPDDSIYTSYLTDAGYEVRSFKNHPQLLKVVKRIDGENQTVNVYLRSGKVVTVPAEQIASLATVPASVILQAAGIKPLPPATAPAAPPDPRKKSDN